MQASAAVDPLSNGPADPPAFTVPEDWPALASASPYRTAVAVAGALDRGDVDGAGVGLKELIEALSRSEKRALKNQLVRLMAHVIKWRDQPERRSRSWRATINNARREIVEIQDETPSLNRAVIESIWDASFEAARDEAEGEMDRDSVTTELAWDEVFERDYQVE